MGKIKNDKEYCPDEKRCLEYPRNCPECGSNSLVNDYSKGEIFCANCGLVIAEKLIDPGSERRAFDSEQAAKRIRTGASMTHRIHDKGLSTSPIKFFFGAKTGWQNRLRDAQRRTYTQTSSERSFVFALGEIDRMGSGLRLPECLKEDTAALYRKAMEKHLIRGRSIEGITTALLHIVCRQYGVSRSLKEVTEISRVGQKEINRARHFLLQKLDLKVSSASPIEFVPRFCSILNLSEETKSYTIEIIKRAIETGLTNGRDPTGTAAAAIYIAAFLNNEHRTQKVVASTCRVTEVTIRNRYKEISQGLQIDRYSSIKNSGQKNKKIRG